MKSKTPTTKLKFHGKEYEYKETYNTHYANQAADKERAKGNSARVVRRSATAEYGYGYRYDLYVRKA
jgi:hypothetical protein